MSRNSLKDAQASQLSNGALRVDTAAILIATQQHLYNTYYAQTHYTHTHYVHTHYAHTHYAHTHYTQIHCVCTSGDKKYLDT
jgi:hypothetical protein